MSLFTILPITVADGSLPTIPTTDVEFLTEGEVSSYGHWILNSNSGSLVDIVNSRVLTPAANQPTYQSNYITVPDTLAHALKTTLFEPASTGGYTLCKVYRFTLNTDILIGWGTLSTGAEVYGGTTYIAQDGRVLNTYRGTFSSTETSLTVAESTWYFHAVSVEYTSLTQMQIDNYIGGLGQHSTGISGANYLRNPAQPISLGNVDYGNELSTQDVAEFIVFDSALSLAQMAEIYSRSQVRMAARGITI